MTRPAIEVRSLDKTYPTDGDPVVALQGIDFNIAQGEFVAVVGPSGCGKSTLLKILAGLDGHSAGSVLMDGRPIAGPRNEVGMVFQSPVLFPWRNVLDNVLLPVDVLGLSRASFTPKAMELLKMAGLDGFEQRYPLELSGGMQQRVGLVRALIHEPSMLLMDEPFGALDALTRERMNSELQRIWLGSGRTVVFVTHAISEAVFLADRVLVMSARPGRIELDLPIPFARPRSLDVIGEPEFGALSQRIRRLLNAQGGLE